jgi:hypothetical protein
MGKYIDSFNRKLIKLNTHYQHDLFKTYLTTVEWRNVEMMEEFAAHLIANKPFYSFPYFKQILELWKIFIKSFNAAKKHISLTKFSAIDYIVMNLFIASFTTIEFLIKGMISLPLSLLLLFKKDNKTGLQKQIAKIFDDYAQFIHHTQFYNYNFFPKIKLLWHAYWHSDKKTIADLITLLFFSVEFLARSILSLPTAFANNQVFSESTGIAHILVKLTSDDATKTEEQLKTELRDAISQAQDELRTECGKPSLALKPHQAHGQEQIFSRSSTKVDKPNRKYAYAHLEVPGYELFLKVASKLQEKNISIKRLAGQDRVQIRYTVFWR